MKKPAGMIFSDLLVRHGRFRLNPERKAKAVRLQSVAQRLDAVRIIQRAGKPVAAILPPGIPKRIGWVIFQAHRIPIPAGIHGIQLHRNFMVVYPLDVGQLVGDRLRTPTAEEDRSAHGLAVFLRGIVRKEKTPPVILRLLPVAARPAHQHDARRANLLAGMQPKMRLASFRWSG